jgi:hypothetical protein
MSPAAPIYDNGGALEADDKAAQLRKLAAIGIAATGSNMRILDLNEAMQGLFEIMHRLAGEIEEELEEMKLLDQRAVGQREVCPLNEA